MFQALKDEELIERFEKLVVLEKKTTAEIVDCIREMDRRKLYLQLGFTSLFLYLTKGLKYSPASAQRRIDAARILQSVPELKSELQSGSINLMQVAMVAQAVRQKEKEEPTVKIDKRQLLTRVKNQDVAATQVILAQDLNLNLKERDRERKQKDESTRVEMTLSKEQMELLNRVKQVISHTHTNPSWPELLELLATHFLNKKDPARDVKPTSKMEVTPSQRRRHIPMPIKRLVFQRDQHCQWRDPNTGQLCGSKFQLQIDHRTPVWEGGGNEIENLQQLCSIHNKYKYEMGL